MQNLVLMFEEKISLLAEEILAYPFEDRESYCRWMNQQFFLVENSSRYLARSASCVPLKAREEFREWAHHLSEEMDHDLSVLKDLRKMGYEPTDEVLAFTRAIIATQYYDIENLGPNALLGYALMLEGLSVKVCAKIADRVEAAHGRGTATYLRLHANVDLDHYPEGIEKVKKLSAEQQMVVQINLETMSGLYLSLLRSLTEIAVKATTTCETHIEAFA